MYAMKRTIIQLLCLMILVGCQKYDIEVFNGPNTNLDRLNGNWVVINYWADWCAPCIKGISTPPAVPASFFINPNGELALSLFRPQTKDELNKIFSELKESF